MYKQILGIVILIAAFVATPAAAQKYRFGVHTGFHNGFGWQLYGESSNFAKGFPLGGRLSLGHSSFNPGNSAEARRIFINNATNGTPEKTGGLWDFRLDFIYPLKLKALPRANLWGGVRYLRFKGNFRYVGGNEDFDVLSNQVGWGAGIESNYGITRSLDFRVSTGIDYYRKAPLNGHDTTYAPDGDNINPRENYSFSDADNAINQPGLELMIMIGFAYRL